MKRLAQAQKGCRQDSKPRLLGYLCPSLPVFNVMLVAATVNFNVCPVLIFSFLFSDQTFLLPFSFLYLSLILPASRLTLSWNLKQFPLPLPDEAGIIGLPHHSKLTEHGFSSNQASQSQCICPPFCVKHREETKHRNIARQRSKCPVVALKCLSVSAQGWKDKAL